MNFGTTKSDMPLVPSGAPSIRASTRWTMFSVEIVLARGDEDLGAGDGVAAVGVGRGPGAEQPEVGAALRLGQVHGAGPLARHQLRQVGLLLLSLPWRMRAAIAPCVSPGYIAEGHVGAGAELVHRRGETLGQSLAAMFGIGPQGQSSRRRHSRGRHRQIRPASSRCRRRCGGSPDVADAVQRL